VYDNLTTFSVLAAQTYEFPPMCNTSTIYTERFKSGNCLRLSDCVLFSPGESFGTCGLGTGSCCVCKEIFSIEFLNDTISEIGRLIKLRFPDHSTCDTTSREWISHFTEPENLEAGPGFGACKFTVEPRHENVCQYRLDFEEFLLSGPNRDSICEHDFIEIFGGSSVPKLCGNLTGQHR